MTFTPSYLHHEKNITCTSVYPVGTSNKTAEHNMMLNVSFSPKDTLASISPADSVSVGSCVNLTCSSTANPPVTNFTWFQISGGKTTQVASGLSYTLNVTAGDGGQYFCEARNSHGCGKSNEVQLAIKGQEETVNTMVFGIAAGTLGVLLLISLISVIGWRRNSRLHDGLERTDSPQGQNSPVGTVCTNQATAGEEPEEPAEDQPEEIQYGDIDFSKLQTKEIPAAAQDRVQGQESVLACFGERNLITTMPDRLDVLTGSCVQIPCSFDIDDPHNTFNSTILTSGVWIKENSNFRERPDRVIFNSSETVNRYQGKITGNMFQKNCTTVFFNVTTSYSDIYYFRIENRPFLATDPDKSVNIVVSDLPSSPIITVSGEVKEGTPVSLNCSAVAPCPEHPPELTWTLPTQFTPENQLQENSDQTKSVLSTVTFTPSYLHHEKNITCTAVYPVEASNKRAEHTMMLNVSFSPKDTSASISPADSASVGSCVNLTCSSIANPPVTNFTWFQISEGETTQVASGQSYTLNVTSGNGELYYCEARNSHGCGKSNEVQLAIKGKMGT
ncbi:unnamed protein product [Oncorhynchus mykiss]|uniref:Ig-like domain-containing protein n=1 Tax=Oncorhynchus mykiss TaxID=8022 RepID=A0A060XPI2_ONCMY|nr:unnamed protein product [Oncorhynchus mykiss]